MLYFATAFFAASKVLCNRSSVLSLMFVTQTHFFVKKYETSISFPGGIPTHMVVIYILTKLIENPRFAVHRKASSHLLCYALVHESHGVLFS